MTVGIFHQRWFVPDRLHLVPQENLSSVVEDAVRRTAVLGCVARFLLTRRH